MKKVLAFSALALALSALSCGDNGVGVDNEGGGGGSSGYTLTTSASPYSGGTVSRSPSQSSYAAGTRVIVTAMPAVGYSFTGWSGASSSTSESITVTMNSNQTLTANFKQASNAVVITLTGWETKETELLGDTKLDPKITFYVYGYRGGSRISSNYTVLLDRDNVGQSWSGSVRSSPIPFASQSDELRIYAEVMEKDPLASDDISPNQYMSWKPIPSAGYSGSASVGSSAKGTSKVSFSYDFIWQ